MLKLDKYSKIDEAQKSEGSVILSDLLCLANIRRTNNLDTTVIADNGNYIEVKGLYDTTYNSRYIVVGREICRITNVVPNSTTSNLYVDRALYGTINSYENRNEGKDYEIKENYSCRDIQIFDVSEWDINSMTGSTSDIFSFQLESATIKVDVENFKEWNKQNTNRIYDFRQKTTVGYFFRGYNGERTLSYTGFAKKMTTASNRGVKNITFQLNDKFVKWYNTPIKTVFDIQNSKPREFFNGTIGIPMNMIYYSGGLTENEFKSVRGIHSKNYSTYADLFGTYAKQGIRFCFDELERIKIFSDFYPSQIIPDVEIALNETNLLDININSDAQLIRNRITGSYTEITPQYDVENDLNGKLKDYKFNLPVSNFTMIDGVEDFNTLEVADDDLFTKTTYQDWILLKDNINGNEFYGKVITKTQPNITEVVLGRFEKDNLIMYRGKYDYLVSQGYNAPRNFTLYYVINGLPTVFKVTLDTLEGDLDSNLTYALLPQIQGDTTDYYKEWTMEFGGGEDLEEATYTGNFYNTTGIYGTWDNTKLFYNREKDQFDNINPPVGVLSNRITSDKGNLDTSILSFDTFDNSNLQLEMKGSTQYDAVGRFRNTQIINPSVLKEDTPVNYPFGSNTVGQLLEVSSLADYRVGDVLVVKEPTNPTVNEKNIWNKVKKIRYVVIACKTEGSNYYLILNNNFPKDFSFIRYPYNTIVFLQEMYIRANPELAITQTIDMYNQTSIDEYDEQVWSIEKSLYDEEGQKCMIDYILRGYNGTDDYKQILPIKARDAYHIQRGDIIKIKDSINTDTLESTLWCVLGCTHTSRSPEVTMSLINLNKFDVNPDLYKFEDRLTTKVIDVNTYSYSGDNTDSGSAIISSTDVDLGNMTIQRTARTVFRINVNSIFDNKITFMNPEGSDVDTWLKTYFSTDNEQEFVVLIDGEYIYLKSYFDPDGINEYYSAVIIKRGLFESKQGIINTDSIVTFYSITAGVSVSGYLSSTSLFVGNDTDHIKFSPKVGMQVKTSGEVGISNNSNRLYFDPATTNNKSQILLGVNWKDGNGNLKPEYDGVEFQVGEESNGGYLKFDNTTGLSMNVKDFKVDGENIIKSAYTSITGDGYVESVGAVSYSNTVDCLFPQYSYGAYTPKRTLFRIIGKSIYDLDEGSVYFDPFKNDRINNTGLTRICHGAEVLGDYLIMIIRTIDYGVGYKFGIYKLLLSPFDYERQAELIYEFPSWSLAGYSDIKYRMRKYNNKLYFLLPTMTMGQPNRLCRCSDISVEVIKEFSDILNDYLGSDNSWCVNKNLNNITYINQTGVNEINLTDFSVSNINIPNVIKLCAFEDKIFYVYKDGTLNTIKYALVSNPVELIDIPEFDSLNISSGGYSLEILNTSKEVMVMKGGTRYFTISNNLDVGVVFLSSPLITLSKVYETENSLYVSGLEYGDTYYFLYKVTSLVLSTVY